ncbi:MAG: acetylxylan esterase [Armatimonadota bacterium]
MGFKIWLTLTALALLAVSRVGAMTIEEMWKGYDPEALPLDVQVVETSEKDGITIQKLYLTSEVWKETPVRVYAIYGFPTGKKHLPAVLHIHGGGGAASLENVMYWAKKGYASASFDHMGKQPGRTVYTDWGKVNYTATYGAWGDSPKNDIYYHAVIASMRMITFLRTQKEVNKDRIGAYGISYGGTFIWLVGALDKRLKCVVPIVGAGSAPDQWGDGSYREWHTLYNSSLYAPMQKCPMLFMNASNDFNAIMDGADYTFNRVNTTKWQAYEVSYNHHFEPTVAADLPLFMDTQLRGGKPWPKMPVLTVTLGTDGIPVANVKPDMQKYVSVVKVHYNLDVGVMPQARYWRTVDSQRAKDGKVWNSEMPIWDPAQIVRAYCDVHYRNGIVLSSVVNKFVPTSLGVPTATLKPQSLIDDFADGNIVDWVWFPAGADPTGTETAGPHLAPSKNGPDGGWAVGANNTMIPGRMVVSTTKICDPQYLPGDHKHLSFKANGEAGTKITIVLYWQYWVPGQTEYKAEVTKPTGPEWATFQVGIADFKDSTGKVLASWKDLQQLRFEATYPADKQVTIGRVEWTD